MANVRPLHDRVLIRRIEETEQKVGGIIIPDSAKEKPLQAEVIAVGSGRMLDTGKKVALTLKPGDKVLIGKWSGTEVKIDDEELLILKEDEVLGVLVLSRGVLRRTRLSAQAALVRAVAFATRCPLPIASRPSPVDGRWRLVNCR